MTTDNDRMTTTAKTTDYGRNIRNRKSEYGHVIFAHLSYLRLDVIVFIGLKS